MNAFEQRIREIEKRVDKLEQRNIDVAEKIKRTIPGIVREASRAALKELRFYRQLLAAERL